MMTMVRNTLITAVILTASLVSAQNGEQGLKFGNLSISPYVEFEYSYDSNVDTAPTNEADDYIFTVTPGIDLSYAGDNWGIDANAWYAYNYYQDYNDQLGGSRYGESVTLWAKSEKGWHLSMGESYEKTHQSDDFTTGGRGIWRDREQFTYVGALSYDFNDKMNWGINASYYDLDYLNDGIRYAPLLGWNEVTVGTMLARQIAAKSNFLISGSWQHYRSKGGSTGHYDPDSTGWSLMVGVGSRATEQVTYQLLGGVSWFDYGNHETSSGFTYSANVHWKINRKLAASLVGASNYQPSEREQGKAIMAYTATAGLTYKPTKALSLSADVAYRYEQSEQSHHVANDYDQSDISGRLAANYALNRFVSIYARAEYQKQFCDERSDYEYDRYRMAIGLRLRY